MAYKVLERRLYRMWSELSDEEKNRVRTKLYSLITEDTDIEDIFSWHLEQAGYPTDLKKRWSLGYSQGDGCSVRGVIPVTDKLFINVMGEGYARIPGMEALRYLIASGYGSLTFNIHDYGERYVHADTMHIEVASACLGDTSRLPGTGGTSPKVESALYLFGEATLSHLKTLCREIEADAYKEIEYRESDEHLTEFFAANEVLFDDAGSPHWGLLSSFEDIPNARFTTVQEVAA